MSWSTILKGAWGVTITLFTAMTTYGQYRSSTVLLRPIVTVESITASQSLRKTHGPFSHSLHIRGLGQVPATDVRLSVVTRVNGFVVHQDTEDALGFIAPSSARRYDVHVPQDRIRGYEPLKHSLLEEIGLSYEGRRRIFQFWCKPLFIYRINLKFIDVDNEWAIQTEPREEMRCT